MFFSSEFQHPKRHLLTPFETGPKYTIKENSVPHIFIFCKNKFKRCNSFLDIQFFKNSQCSSGHPISFHAQFLLWPIEKIEIRKYISLMMASNIKRATPI